MKSHYQWFWKQDVLCEVDIRLGNMGDDGNEMLNNFEGKSIFLSQKIKKKTIKIWGFTIGCHLCLCPWTN